MSTNPSELDNNAFFGEKKPTMTAKIPAGITPMGGDESIVEVAFCTGGRLSAPPTLHFYDYNMAAAQLLAELNDHDEKLPLIARVLNQMVVEPFDCGLLHREEIKEVLLSVHAKWWGSKLDGFKYLLKEDLPEEDKYKPENVSVATIPLSCLVIKPLADNIAEPINVTSHGVTVKLLFPRAQNTEVTKNYLNTKFALEEQRFFKIRQDLAKNRRVQNSEDLIPIDPVLEKEYEDYVTKMTNERLLISRAQTLYGIGDEVFETLEERIQALASHREVTVDHWDMYNKFLESEGSFGVQDEVEFFSDVLNQKVKRTFPFYSYSFIPVSVDRVRDESSTITFG